LANAYLGAETTVDSVESARDQAIAGALEEFQNVCGTAADVSLLLGRLTGEEGARDLGTCPLSSENAKIPHVCIGGRGIANLAVILSGDPELEKLSDCVTNSNKVATVHLGGSDDPNADFSICATKGLNGKICASEKCPIVVTDAIRELENGDIKALSSEEVCLEYLEKEFGIVSGTGRRSTPYILGPKDGLGLFDTLSTLPPPRAPTVCGDIRKIRRQGLNGDPTELIEGIRSSGIFTQSALREARKRIKVEATPGGFIDVLVDDDVVLSTGNYSTGITQGWPCEGKPPVADCREGDGLFCAKIEDCSSFTDIHEYTNRLVSAVGNALVMSYSGGDPELPYLELHKGRRVNSLKNQAVQLGQATLPMMLSSDLEMLDSSAQLLRLKYYLDPASSSAQSMLTGGALTLSVGARGSSLVYLQGDERPDFFHHVGFSYIDGAPRAYPGRQIHANGTFTPALIKFGLLIPESAYANFFAGLGSVGAGDGILYSLLRDDFVSRDVIKRSHPGMFGFPWTHLDADRMGSCPLFASCPSYAWEGLYWHGFQRSTLSDDRDGALFHKEFLGVPRTAWSAFAGDRPYRVGEFHLISLKSDAILDGLELLCEVLAGDAFGDHCGSAPPEVSGISDLEPIGRFMQCKGDEILAQAAGAILTNFPEAATKPLFEGGDVEFAPGTLGAAYSSLRSALIDLAASRPAIGRTVRGLGYDMESFTQQMAILGLREQMNSVNFEAKQAQNVTSCLSSMASAISATNWGAGAAAAATCGNSMVQSGLANELLRLEGGENAAQVASAVADFNRSFDDSATSLEQQEILMSGSIEQIGNALGMIESERSRAARALNRALWYMSDEGSAVAGLVASRNLSKERYERAHINAQRLAFLAKRAIEQRLGVYLSDMTEDLPLVVAPQRWESSVCASSPIDYSQLKQDDGSAVPSFADSFVGDYVEKLSNVVESYRLEYDFSEGVDTSVISLRDDIVKTRASCEVPGENLLLHAGDLNMLEYGGTGAGVWSVTGCAENSWGGSTRCAEVSDAMGAGGNAEELQRPFLSPVPRLASVRGFNVQFGTSNCQSSEGVNGQGGAGGASTTAEDCGWNDQVLLGQTILLGPGKYRFSWYSGDDTPSKQIGSVTQEGVPVQIVDSGIVRAGAFTWARPFVSFELSEGAEVRVGFQSASTEGGASYRVAAPMLEKSDSLSTQPGVFHNTGATNTVLLSVCPDTNGEVFRTGGTWRKGCELLCPDGFSSDCRGKVKKECYWETSFHLSQRAIESGQQLESAGFAKGNFNYRIERLGINFVGTGLRDCSSSESPQSCYASGFVPYSVKHYGPYYVRNHFGQEFEAKLFSGNIEHARGLANERYITNPLATSDRDQVEQYMRSELQGRPIDGTFVVRIWDEPGVNFAALEDVQLVLDYRYWTRNN